MAPAFHVNGVVAGIEKYPTEDVIEAASAEARKKRISDTTQLALTARKLIGPFTRRPGLKPGELPKPRE